MHIILGLVGGIITILVLLNRLAEAGIDLGGLNPFLWQRRRKFRQMYDGNPVFSIDNPMDATAILMVAAAKADGDISREDKTLILELFVSEFHLSKKDASGLLISSSHLLGDGTEVRSKIRQFIAPSKDTFSEEQAASAVSLVERAASHSGSIHVNAAELLAGVKAELTVTDQPNNTW